MTQDIMRIRFDLSPNDFPPIKSSFMYRQSRLFFKGVAQYEAMANVDVSGFRH